MRAEKNAEQLHGTLVKALEISLDSLDKDPKISVSQQQVLDELMLAHKRLIDEEAEQVEITTETFECYERLARIYRDTARYDKANAICDQADRMVERCFKTVDGRKKFGLCATEVFLQRGLVADETGDREAQASAYRKSVEFLRASEAHSDRIAWLEKGFRVYRNWAFTELSRNERLGRAAFELAAQCATEPLELDPESEQAQFNAAMCFSDMGHLDQNSKDWMLSLERLEEAERRFMAIAANPESKFDCRYRLCYIRNETGRHLRVRVKDYERAEAYIRKSVEGLHVAPVLKAKSTGFGNEGVYNYVGMMATYQYDGATSGTVSYNWALDAILTEPDDTAAFIRYNGALVTGADFFTTSQNDFSESTATREDWFSFTQGDAGTIDESGTISFDANPGDVFYLVTGLQTYAGRAGAITDAFNTGTGNFTVTGGGSISSLSAVPEPAAASILALFGIVGFSIRRRQR